MAVVKKEKTIQQKWLSIIEDRGLKQIWVADKAGISPPHLSNILAERVLLTQENVDNINSALGTDFTQPE